MQKKINSLVSIRIELVKQEVSIDALPRCKDVAWRACCSLLPIRDSLRRKGVDVDPACPLCVEYDETVTHIWLECPIARGFWFGHLMSMRMETYIFFDKSDGDLHVGAEVSSSGPFSRGPSGGG